MRLNASLVGVVLVVATVVGVEFVTAVSPRAQIKKALTQTVRRANAPNIVSKIDTIPAKARVPASFAAKITTASSRDVMVRSILADPAAKASLSQAAEARGLTPEQLLSGSNPPSNTVLKSTYGGSTTRQVVARIPQTGRMKTADDEAFDQIDWKAGVTITPFSSPTYGAAKYAVGTIEVQYSVVQSWLPEVLLLYPPYLAHSWYGTANLYLDLPMEPAMYMIAVKITGDDGSCPASWVQPDAMGYSPLFIEVSGASVLPRFTPLLDGSGYVGLCTFDRQYEYPAEYRGMRRTTASVYISISRGEAEYPGKLVFGGFTIAKM